MENNIVFMGWKKINFIEREDQSERITFYWNLLSFFKGAFSAYVEKVEEIRSGTFHEKCKQEFLVNQEFVFNVTLGEYGRVEYVCTYSERQESEKDFGQKMLELSQWAGVPWHIAKITKGMDFVEGYEILCAIKKVANSDPLTSTERNFLMKRDLKLRNCILERLFSRKVWDKIKEPVTQVEINSRHLAYYILVKGEIQNDLNVYCSVPKAFDPISESDIFHHNMNIRALKTGLGVDFVLCTVSIENNLEAIKFLKHMRNVIAATGVKKSDDCLFCSEDSYYRNSMIRHFFGEEIWATIGPTLLNKTACSLAVGHYLYQHHRRGKG